MKKTTANSNNIRDVEDLLSFLQNSSKISVTEFVGMVQNVYACKCMSRVAKDRVWIEILRHLHRHELKNVADFTEVLKVAHVCFDGALYSHFCRLSARGQDWKIWCQRNKDIAAYTLDHADLDAVLGSLSDLPAVAKSISRLYASPGCLGPALFTQPRDALGSKILGSMMTALLNTVKAKEFDASSIAEYHNASGAKESSFIKARITEKRQVPFLLAMMPGTVVVTSTTFERDLHLAVLVRECSLGKVGGIPMLPCERVLRPDLIDSTDKSIVPEHLITGVIDFREMYISDMEKTRRHARETARSSFQGLGILHSVRSFLLHREDDHRKLAISCGLQGQGEYFGGDALSRQAEDYSR